MVPARADAQLRPARHAAYQADRSQAPLWCNHVSAWMVPADDPNQPAPPRRRPDRRTRRRRRACPTCTAAGAAPGGPPLHEAGRGDRPTVALGPVPDPGLARADHWHSGQPARAQPVRHQRRRVDACAAVGAAGAVRHGALGGRLLQRPVRAGHGHGGNPVRPQRPPETHRAGGPGARPHPQPAVGQHPSARPRTADDPRHRAQRARRRVAAVRDPRLVQPRHRRDVSFRGPPPARRRLADRPDHAAADQARPECGHRGTAHLRQHRDALVGRIPDLRQHAGVPGRRAPPRTGQGKGRDRGGPPDRHRPVAARQLRRPRRLVGRAGAVAHAVHARAQRRLRHARRELPRLVGRRGVR